MSHYYTLGEIARWKEKNFEKKNEIFKIFSLIEEDSPKHAFTNFLKTQSKTVEICTDYSLYLLPEVCKKYNKDKN